jgi:ZIP family zinc transporter
MLIDVLLLGLMALGGTCLGGLFSLLPVKYGERFIDSSLGFAGGIMLTIVFLEFLEGSIARAGLSVACLAFVLGIATLLLLDRYLPHIHAKFLESKEGRAKGLITAGLLIAAGLALHNAPEGIAIGSGYSATPALGVFVAVAITINNFPEGMAIAIPLRAGGLGRMKPFLIASLTGLVEPLAAVLSFFFLQEAPIWILGFVLAFAGGAMLYITCDELIPESHAHGYEHEATIALVIGILLALFLSEVIMGGI